MQLNPLATTPNGQSERVTSPSASLFGHKNTVNKLNCLYLNAGDLKSKIHQPRVELAALDQLSDIIIIVIVETWFDDLIELTNRIFNNYVCLHKEW